MCDWAEEDDSGEFPGGLGGADILDEVLEFLAVGTGAFVVAFVVSEEGEHDVGFHMLEVGVDGHEAPAAGEAVHSVPGDGQVAKAELFVLLEALEGGFEPTVVLEAFPEGVTKDGYGVAGLEGKVPRVAIVAGDFLLCKAPKAAGRRGRPCGRLGDAGLHCLAFGIQVGGGGVRFLDVELYSEKRCGVALFFINGFADEVENSEGKVVEAFLEGIPVPYLDGLDVVVLTEVEFPPSRFVFASMGEAALGPLPVLIPVDPPLGIPAVASAGLFGIPLPGDILATSDDFDFRQRELAAFG